MSDARRIGSDAEDRAAEYLLNKGWTLVGRRIKLTHGEIDLICLDEETVVFVEVRSRTKGGAEESITAQKMNRLRLSAEEFIAKSGYEAVPAMRIDVLAENGGVWTHISSAIESAD